MLAALLLMVALVQGAAGACPTAAALGAAAETYCAEHAMEPMGHDAGRLGPHGRDSRPHAHAAHGGGDAACPGGAACGGCPLIAADTSAAPAAGKPAPASITREFHAASAPVRASAFEPPPPKA